MQFKERKYERFNYKAPVLFKHKKDQIWSWGTSVDISFGGLLLQTDNLIPQGEIIALEIASMEKGALFSLSAKIVRVIDSPPRGPAIAIEFISPASAPELTNLLDFIKTYLIPVSDGPPVNPWEKENALKTARELMDRAQFMDYYQTLDLSKNAMPDEIKTRREELMKVLNIHVNGLTEREIKTLRNSIGILERLAGILSNPERRLAYDIAMGKVSPITVKKLADSYNINLTDFQKFWNEKYPGRVQKSQKLLKNINKTENKLEVLLEAANLDPFNREILSQISG